MYLYDASNNRFVGQGISGYYGAYLTGSNAVGSDYNTFVNSSISSPGYFGVEITDESHDNLFYWNNFTGAGGYVYDKSSNNYNTLCNWRNSSSYKSSSKSKSLCN